MSTDQEPLPQATGGTAPGLFTRDQIGHGGEAQLRSLVTLLDVQAQQPGVVRLRQWTVDALAVSPGETAVDVGSGTGSEVLRLAALVGDQGRAIGVEPNPGLRAEAEARAREEGVAVATFVDGDATALPFDGSTVDVLRCERVLQHLPDPQVAVDEFARVLTPGGRVALVDSDWGSTIMHPGDPGVVRRYAESNWSRIANPFSGRHLANQLRTAGLTVDSDIGSQALVMPVSTILSSGLLTANAAAAVAAGYLAQDEADTLLMDLEAAAEKDTAFLSVTMFSVVARKSA